MELAASGVAVVVGVLAWARAEPERSYGAASLRSFGVIGGSSLNHLVCRSNNVSAQFLVALSHGDSLGGASRATRWKDSTVTLNDSPAVGGGIENGQRPRDEMLP